MGSKVNKGFFFYLMVLVGIAFAGALIGVAVMIFGKVSIFGVNYFSHNSVAAVSEAKDNVYILEKEYQVPENYVFPDATSKTSFSNLFPSVPINSTPTHKVKGIIIDAGLHSVRIETTSSSVTNPLVAVNLQVKTNVKGFTKSEDKGAFKVIPYIQDEILTLKVVGLDNFFNFSNGSVITLQIPQGLNNYFRTNQIQLSVITKSGSVTYGQVPIASSQSIVSIPNTVFGSVNFKTESGNIRLTKYAEIASGSINSKDSSFETVSGKITIDKAEEDSSLNFGQLKIKTKNGNITFNRSIKAVKDVKIECVRSYMVFNDIECNTLEFTGESGKLNAKVVYGNVAIQSETKYTHFVFEKVDGSFFVYGSTKSSVKIGKLNVIKTDQAATINTKDGDITIDEVIGSVIIETTTGKVNVKKCKANIDVTTKSGSVDVEMVGGENDGNIKIESENAKVKVVNITSQLTLKGDGEIYVEFKSLDSSNYRTKVINSTIVAEKGKVTTMFSKDYETSLTVKGSPSVSYDNVDKGDFTKNDFEINVNDYKGSNKSLVITTSKAIVIDFVA